MKIEVDPACLKATALFAAAKDSRYYLNGVQIESGHSETRLVATDGGAVAVCRIPQGHGEGRVVSGIIPIEAIKTLKTGGGIVSLSIDDGTYTLAQGVTATSGKCIDGVYPDWRRVIPDTFGGEPATLDQKYIDRVMKAQDLLVPPKNRRVYAPITYSGVEGSALFRVGDDFAGIIGPTRTHMVDAIEIPDWLKTTAL
jgi:DNA polymerase-3 subunit beta